MYPKTDDSSLLHYYNGSKFCLAKNANRLLTPFIFDAVFYPFASAHVLVNKDAKWGLFNITAEKYSIQPIHKKGKITDCIESAIPACVFSIKNEANKWAFTTYFSEKVSDFAYDTLITNTYGVIAAQQGKKWALKYRDDAIGGFEYDAVDFKTNGFIIYNKQGKYGLRTSNNEYGIKTVYSKIEMILNTDGTYSNDVFGTREGKKYKVSVETGEELD
jgi:hypothetical protein